MAGAQCPPDPCVFQVDAIQVAVCSVPRGPGDHQGALLPDPFCGSGGSGAAGRGGCHPAVAGLAPATGGQRDAGGQALGPRGLVPRDSRGEEGPRGVDRFFSRVAQPPARRGGRSRPRPRAADPRRVRTKSERSRARRGGRREPPSPRGRRFVTSLVSQQARAARAPPTPARRLAARVRLRCPRFPSLRGRAPAPAVAEPPSGRPWLCARWLPPGGPARGGPRPPPQPGAARRPAPQSAAHSRRRDAVLLEGDGLRPLPPGDLVVRRLHHLLRSRRALRARQPFPPLHQVRGRVGRALGTRQRHYGGAPLMGRTGGRTPLECSAERRRSDSSRVHPGRCAGTLGLRG